VSGIGDRNSTWKIQVRDVDFELWAGDGTTNPSCTSDYSIRIKIEGPEDLEINTDQNGVFIPAGITSFDYDINLSIGGSYTINVYGYDTRFGGSSDVICSTNLKVEKSGDSTNPTCNLDYYTCTNILTCPKSAPIDGGWCIPPLQCCDNKPIAQICSSPTCINGGEATCQSICKGCPQCKSFIPTFTPIPPVPDLDPLCDRLPGIHAGRCLKCQDEGKIYSALGCLPTNFGQFLQEYIFKYGMGIAGAISFLYLIFGAFQVMTSAGNAEKVAQAKEVIVSSLSGLLLVIFSLLLLKIIGVDILQIPGFK
jgi:hypothetical protein